MGGGGGETKSTGGLPWWVQGAHKELIGQAEVEAYGGPGGQIYDGQRIAGLSSQEIAAGEAREAMFNEGDQAGQFAQAQYGKAADLTGQMQGVANTEFGMDEYNRRKNPYYDAVIAGQLREADQSFGRRINQDQARSVARGGSVGSYGVMQENAFLEGERAQTLGDISNQGNLANWDQASASFRDDRGVKLQGLASASDSFRGIGQGLSDTGTASLARRQSMTNELERSGAVQREMAQREMDLAVQDHDFQRDQAKRDMSWLSGILSGVPNQQLATQTTSIGAAPLSSQVASLGLAGASAYNLIGGGTG